MEECFHATELKGRESYPKTLWKGLWGNADSLQPHSLELPANSASLVTS